MELRAIPLVKRLKVNAGKTELAASFFFGVRIMLGMNFNYLILWVRVKGQG